MLSPRVDLTEHRDFSGGGTILFNTPIEIPYDEYELMSPDEYERLRWWESIFGRRGHRNQKWNIFSRIGLDIHYDPENPHPSYCIRCGKPIRIPWKNYYGLCFECNNKTEATVESKIPWNHTMNFSSRNDERGYNLFNSK